jgi:hypothetical protein
MATPVPQDSSTDTAGRRKSWSLRGIVIVGVLVVFTVSIVAGYFSDYHRALRAIRDAGGTTDADAMDEGPVAVRSVWLRGPRVTDAEVERVAPHLSHLPELYTLDLSLARVTDHGLGHLRGLNHLGDIILRYTHVGDEGLHHLQGWDKLRTLDLMHTRITDRCLETIGKNHPDLRALDLDETLVTDGGLTRLKTLRHLEWLALARTAVTDAGLDAVQAWPELQMLSLTGTRVTDVGLQRLESTKHLRTLAVGRTRVTDAGLARLQAVLPSLRVIR